MKRRRHKNVLEKSGTVHDFIIYADVLGNARDYSFYIVSNKSKQFHRRFRVIYSPQDIGILICGPGPIV